MFCHKCGKKIEDKNVFCQHCGEPISNHKTEDVIDNIHETKHTNLEKKAWFRIAKVIYILFILLTVGIIIAVAVEEKPTKSLNGDMSSIICDNGKSYAPNKNQIYVYGTAKDLDYSNDKDARILCKYDNLNFYAHSGEFIAKNYQFNPVYTEPEGSGSWLGYTALAFIIAFVVFKLIKIIFLYIVIGEKPKLNLS